MKLLRLVIEKTLFISIPMIGGFLFAVFLFFIETEKYGGDEVSLFYYPVLVPTVIAYFVLEKKLNLLKSVFLSIVLYQQCTSWYSTLNPTSEIVYFPDYIIRYLKLAPNAFLIGTAFILLAHLITLKMKTK